MNEEMIKTGVEEDMPQKFKIERIKKSAPTAERGKVPDPHMHPFHEIFYLESGTCSSLIGHTLYTFEKGDIVTLTIDGITSATNVKNDMVGKFAIPTVGVKKLAINDSKAGSLVFKVIDVDTLAGKDALVLEVQ